MNNSTAGQNESIFDLSDMELVERALQNDDVACELIVRRHNQALFRAARGIVDDRALAQEVMQEAYLKAFSNLNSFKGRASLKTWLTRIVVNQAISFKRRQQSMISLNEKVTLLHRINHAEAEMNSPIADRVTPENIVSQQEIKKILESAINQLPDIYRCVFMLRDVEGMSVADSAYCLDISEGLIKTRLSRARKMLRQDLILIMEVQGSGLFEFAGNSCEVITHQVMTELARRRMI